MKEKIGKQKGFCLKGQLLIARAAIGWVRIASRTHTAWRNNVSAPTCVCCILW
jgi:hypothetical protein